MRQNDPRPGYCRATRREPTACGAGGRCRRFRSTSRARHLAGAALIAFGLAVDPALAADAGPQVDADTIVVTAADYAIYLPYPSGTTTAYTPAYSINQEGRRLWLSVNVDF
ncbi:hypothetical protein G432_13720 [Sphingomonas sp. MM-1]|uniref:hypothetical protein n=1 Tax=Sphingomonas sp. MM-1 TaxID=745310 RepID=UPI0002C0CBDF|nr:hypothetical protein [Sphingomonas sp. MM-1]AGH50462.1 hypothetical protein G432_13720 [Sphingomonas sp. MM-1]